MKEKHLTSLTSDLKLHIPKWYNIWEGQHVLIMSWSLQLQREEQQLEKEVTFSRGSAEEQRSHPEETEKEAERQRQI